MSASTDRIPHPVMNLTTLRKSAAPFLPPPLLRLIHAVDSYAYIHRASVANSTDATIDEASMTLLSSIFVSYIIWKLIKTVAYLFSNKRSTAHLSDEGVLGNLGADASKTKDQSRGANTIKFDATVIIFGAMNSGKTALLHRLMCNDKRECPITVSSTIVNVCYLAAGDTNNNIVRIIDYPGHPALRSQFTQLLHPTSTSRLIFTIDSTQPVTESVSMLYQSILIHPTVRQQYREGKLNILITCTKTDLKGAKNYKRVKIQIRNELERLRKLDSVVNNKDENDLSLKGKNIDLDDLGHDVSVKFYFVEVSQEGSDITIVRDFVLNGTVPSHDKK